MAVDGLRERKKQRTRQEISDVATRLFGEHGFEQVTLAQIADAADVSVKTIFNYFGSKEDLYFDRADEMRDGITATITSRPAGTTILQALHALLRDNLVPFPGTGWKRMNDAGAREDFNRFIATQDRSPALQARRLTLGEELGAHLTGVIAAELGRDPEDPAVRAMSAALIATMNLRDRVLRASVAAGLPPRTIRRRVVEVVDETFARLQRAFDDVDR